MKYRKRPVVIDAVQLTVDNAAEVARWSGSRFYQFEGDERRGRPPETVLIIPTLEGNHRAGLGDWIVCGVKGEFYPVKDEIFRETYERAEMPDQTEVTR